METTSTPAPADLRNRKYSLSIDWLQFSVFVSQHFAPDTTNMWGYTTKRKDSGSKVWRDIYEVYDDEGVEIATLACHPHSSAIDSHSGVIKFDNSLLYEADAIDRCFAAVKMLGLQYRGITRIDLAYDCNELYNGLRVDNLVAGYLNGKYIKRGQNKWMLVGDSNYYCTSDGIAAQLYSRKPDHLKTQAEIKAERKREMEMISAMEGTTATLLPHVNCEQLSEVPTYLFGSLTWGFRSNAIQVQVYDKSRELREVKFKKHIWQTWQNSGLDTTRPVYRIEIRIQNQGKHVINLQTGKAFVLSAIDIITQEQIEQLFFDYAEKYFCFHHNDGGDLRHKERMPRLKVLSLSNEPVCRPKRTAFGVDYTRGTKIALNQLNKEIVANRKIDNEVAASLREARDYLARTYELHDQQKKWMQEDLVRLSLSDPRFKEVTPEVYFELRLAGAPEKLAASAAAHEQLLEIGVTMEAAKRARMASNGRAVSFAEQPLFRFFNAPSIKELINKGLLHDDATKFIPMQPATPPPPKSETNP